MTHELHPLCVLFPRLVGAEFDSLRDDIAANGLRTPIVLHEGMILDGGNRYAACVAAGVEPSFTEFAGGNLVAFVLGANLHRRHMSAGQRAAIVATATDWARAHVHGGDRKSDQGEALHLDRSVDRAATSGATTRTQKDADKLARKHPKVALDVAQGKKSLYQAVAETKPATKAAAKPKPAAKTRAKPVPAKSAKQIEHEQIEEDAHGDFDPLAELEEAHKTIEKLQAEIKAAQADDAKAEVLKWHRMYDSAVRAQSDAMDRSKEARDREARIKKQLMRCGKAVGQEDPDKIAPAVEAFVREHKKVPA